MDPAKRKSRLVNFRVSESEFQELQILCETNGIRSISALARLALDRVREQADALHLNGGTEETLRSLSRRIKALERGLKKIGQGACDCDSV